MEKTIWIARTREFQSKGKANTKTLKQERANMLRKSEEANMTAAEFGNERLVTNEVGAVMASHYIGEYEDLGFSE